MALYQIAFRESVAVSVVEQFADCWSVVVRSMFLSEYGLTIFAEIEDESVLEEWDWAFCMYCNMEQEAKI